MLTLSDKLCTIANGNRTWSHILNYLLKPILFIVTTERIGGASGKSTTKKKKKSADQFEVKPPREKYRLKFIKLKLARLQIFRN